MKELIEQKLELHLGVGKRKEGKGKLCWRRELQMQSQRHEPQLQNELTLSMITGICISQQPVFISVESCDGLSARKIAWIVSLLLVVNSNVSEDVGVFTFYSSLEICFEPFCNEVLSMDCNIVVMWNFVPEPVQYSNPTKSVR
jgi:hypothetical protein